MGLRKVPPRHKHVDFDDDFHSINLPHLQPVDLPALRIQISCWSVRIYMDTSTRQSVGTVWAVVVILTLWLAVGLLDISFLVMYVIYIIGFIYLPARAVIDSNLPPVSTLVVIAEQVSPRLWSIWLLVSLISQWHYALICVQARMLMKTHAFVRENAPNTLNVKENSSAPDFSKYLYFLFAPTLIYRDEYPR